MPPQEPRFNFLALPPEIRLHFYECILTCKPQVMPDLRPPAERSIAPTILRTCKQIHREASPALYSQNKFLIANPERILRWLQKIGRVNIGLLKSIRLFPHAVYCTEDSLFGDASVSRAWYRLLDRLAREATGLRRVYIYWDSADTFTHFGAGRDVRFVRELAGIQGLQSMVVDGYYAVHWPRYLAENMGVPVQERGQEEQWYLESLRRYQRGTENLIP